MPDKSRDSSEANLGALIEISAVTRTLTEPALAAVERLLETTAGELFSREASVLVLDAASGELRFLAAVGSVSEQLQDLRVPRGKGIAGFVFSSGQPMAVADADAEESFYSEVDAATGFSTETILATPLRSDGEVIGVLEYVNRVDGGPSKIFTADDMDRAAFFADLIAPVVSTCLAAEAVGGLGEAVLASEGEADFDRVADIVRELTTSEGHRELLKIASLVREVAGRGEAERRMVIEVFESLKRYFDLQNRF